jgi:hypothetical protein
VQQVKPERGGIGSPDAVALHAVPEPKVAAMRFNEIPMKSGGPDNGALLLC